jgi:ElaB/YqjD/DUF883 family membrane-anchored ribosome-binding protein
MSEQSNFATARTQLLDDFDKITADAEALLRAMASVPGEKASALRESVAANLAAAKQRVRDLHGQAYERSAAAVRATDDYVHENAWQVIAGAAAIGFVIGFLVRGSSDD